MGPSASLASALPTALSIEAIDQRILPSCLRSESEQHPRRPAFRSSLQDPQVIGSEFRPCLGFSLGALIAICDGQHQGCFGLPSRALVAAQRESNPHIANQSTRARKLLRLCVDVEVMQTATDSQLGPY